MLQESAPMKTCRIEDSIIESDNCFDTLLRSSSETKNKTQKKKSCERDSARRGISLYQNHSSHNLCNQKLTIKTQENHSIKQISNYLMNQKDGHHLVHTKIDSSPKKYLTTRKCVDYKNRRVMENNNPTDLLHSNFSITIERKTSEENSVYKFTPRTALHTQQTSNNLSSILQKCNHQSIVFEKRVQFSPRHDQSFSVVRESPLIEIHEYNTGKRVKTIQSQHFESESDLYSIVQSFVWPTNT